MESASNQSFDSDVSEKCFNVEDFGGHESAEDEFSQIVKDSSKSSPLVGGDDVQDPYIGMEFESRDEAREFYIAYGRRTGFTIRIHHNRRSRVNNEVIGQDFVCSKEGFREKKYIYRRDRVLPPPPVTREGCPAMLRLALRDGVKWVVTKCVLEHNHALVSPRNVPWRGSTRSLVSEVNWTFQDEKDRRIRELTIELNNERQRCKRQCTAYQEKLRLVLSYVEEHTNHLSSKVQDVVKNVKELEDEHTDDLEFTYI